MLTDALRRIVGEARCKLFDWQHNVRTCGVVNLEGLTIAGNNASNGVFFHPSHPKFLFEVGGGLNIDYGRYIFIDLGSGKGRPLLIASEFPFLEIVGVEFARELNDVACENIRTYRSTSQNCKRIQSLHADATEFMFPPLPTVLFLFNPFGPAVLSPVLRNLQNSLESHPRDAILIYVAPFHGNLIERETTLKCVERSTYHNTYRVLPAPTNGVRSKIT